MLKLTDSERKYLLDLRALTTNVDGEEVLAGLDKKESEEYLSYKAAFKKDNHSDCDSKRYLELHNKHENVRLATIVAEVDLRNEKPIKH